MEIALGLPTKWKELTRGFAFHETIRSGFFGTSPRVMAFRIDLRLFRPRILVAPSVGDDRALVSAMAKRDRVPLAVNGGFFTVYPTRSLGLLVDRGKQLNPLRQADWGVFSVVGQRAALTHAKRFRTPRALDFAIECGPRLVVDGKPTKLKRQKARRTALGIQSPERIVLVVSTASLETAELARLFADAESDGGFGCRDALNLDGGSSTQIYCQLGAFRRIWDQGVRVTNAVAFESRGAKR
ncbi:MAG: phosphodiester glycosidase family protein [Myxococcales bacterium]|nr:phosphodiester glycosidase family protein [Myxococcales bacterium]